MSDPWAASAAKLPSRNSEKYVSQQQLDQMEARISARIQASLHDEDEVMQPADLDSNPKIKEIEQTQHVQSQQTQSIKQQLNAQSQTLTNHIDTRLQQQMEQIESLLKKRHKSGE